MGVYWSNRSGNDLAGELREIMWDFIKENREGS